MDQPSKENVLEEVLDLGTVKLQEEVTKVIKHVRDLE